MFKCGHRKVSFFKAQLLYNCLKIASCFCWKFCARTYQIFNVYDLLKKSILVVFILLQLPLFIPTSTPSKGCFSFFLFSTNENINQRRNVSIIFLALRGSDPAGHYPHRTLSLRGYYHVDHFQYEIYRL